MALLLAPDAAPQLPVASVWTRGDGLSMLPTHEKNSSLQVHKSSVVPDRKFPFPVDPRTKPVIDTNDASTTNKSDLVVIHKSITPPVLPSSLQNSSESQDLSQPLEGHDFTEEEWCRAHRKSKHEVSSDDDVGSDSPNFDDDINDAYGHCSIVTDETYDDDDGMDGLMADASHSRNSSIRQAGAPANSMLGRNPKRIFIPVLGKQSPIFAANLASSVRTASPGLSYQEQSGFKQSSLGSSPTPPTSLEDVVLGWTFQEIQSDESKLLKDVKTVPAMFTSMRAHQQMFESFLLEELRSELQPLITLSNVKKPNFLSMTVYQCGSSAAAAHSKHRMNMTLDYAENSTSGFPQTVDARRWFPKTNDLVIILLDSSVSESKRPFVLALVVKIVNDKSIVVSIFPMGMAWKAELKVHVHYCFPLVPWQRQYKALTSIPPFMHHIVLNNCSPEPSPELSDSKITICPKLKSILNPFQVDAVQGALGSSSPVSLVQGPPGTGKSHTLVACLRAYYDAEFEMMNGSKEEKVLSFPILSTTSKPTKAMLIQPPKTIGITERSLSRKVLICAPSNAAVDNIVRILSRGQLDRSDGKKHVLNMVRLGEFDKMQSDAKKISLDVLIKEEIARLLEFQEFSSEKKFSSAVTDKLEKLKEDKFKTLKRKYTETILSRSHIIFCTLNGSAAASLLNFNCVMDLALIDEACQCTEAESLVPLQHGCKKMVLFGDPKQLAASIKSSFVKIIQNSGRSFFARILESLKKSNNAYFLAIQYRMHPAICQFPSQCFYDGKLKNDEKVEKRGSKDWQNAKIDTVKASPLCELLLQPYSLIHINSKDSSTPNNGFVNHDEADRCLRLFIAILKACPSQCPRPKVAVITPYSAQRELIKTLHASLMGACPSPHAVCYFT